MSDNIDAAINGASSQPVQMRRFGPIGMVTGRPFFMDVPLDMSAIEIADISRWLATQLLGALQQAEQRVERGPAIHLPNGQVVPVKADPH